MPFTFTAYAERSLTGGQKLKNIKNKNNYFRLFFLSNFHSFVKILGEVHPNYQQVTTKYEELGPQPEESSPENYSDCTV